MIMGQYDGIDGNFAWEVNQNFSNVDELSFVFSPTGNFADQVHIQTTGADMATGTWYFVAISANSSRKIRIHVGASGTAAMVASSTPSSSAMSNEATKFSVGSPSGFGSSGQRYDGQLDDVRFTKGVCRYDTDSAITVPTAAFPNSS